MSSDITVGISRRGRVIVVAVAGEIDIASTPQLERLLEEACAGGADIVVDLAEVTFMDVSGLRALLDARRRAERDGVPLALANVPPAVVRLLKLTRAYEELTIIDGPGDSGGT